ncbi:MULTISPECIES: hypothetical protein [Streptomyces]|uniref:Secreted protein n=1 Tax=Streptomyces lasiicapitis TaxID=1923961 RepID=A0ABQ2LS84_9ACTN|nr:MULTISPECIES: hypothetical protein [Streptomyces]QIB47529.1 hypothetical protein G3H79_35060 [Streptomyces aureoverticillatus]GGO42068.1 hypothetical protein GCM10012286_22770 [Streptomyces lasiicapitis]
MRTLLAAATALLAVGLTGAPAQAGEAGQQPTAPHRAAAASHFDVLFNTYGYSPKTDRPQGNRQRVALSAYCNSDFVAGQLYHVTWGRDRPVGNVVKIHCGTRRSAVYDLSGGEYYFYFLSGVDNTRVVGDWD